MCETIDTTVAEKVEKAGSQSASYEKPEVKTLCQRDVVQAVNQGSKFPARGFAG